jgi:large subunit ribosomal protein L29
MKAKELRDLSDEKLGEELLKLRREQFNLRMQAATGQGAKPDQHGKVRRSIARLKTVQGERARGVQPPAPAPEASAAPAAKKKARRTKATKAKKTAA